jgi:hypothetical protein
MTQDFPSALYGRNLNVTGMEYCYTASANASVSQVVAYHNVQTSNAGATFTAVVNDATPRTDAACRYYSFTPMAVDDNTILSIFVNGAWGPSGANQQLRLGRVTFYFQPTDTLVVAPMGLEMNAEDAPNVPEAPRPNPE